MSQGGMRDCLPRDVPTLEKHEITYSRVEDKC